MIGTIGSFVASMQAAQQAMDQAKANAMRNAYYQRHPEMVEAMRNALALERYKQSNVNMAHMPYHRAKTFTDEALKLMAAEPDHREEIKAHAIECLEQFPDQAVVAPFIEQLLTA
jgi:hypothetical protein